MGIAKILFAVGFLFMAAILTYAFVVGHFFDEARILFKYPWFHATLADLYTGLSLFSGWVIYRERSVGRSVLWIFLFVTLGNLITALYALIVAVQSRGDWNLFWLGNHRTLATTPARLSATQL